MSARACCVWSLLSPHFRKGLCRIGSRDRRLPHDRLEGAGEGRRSGPRGWRPLESVCSSFACDWIFDVITHSRGHVSSMLDRLPRECTDASATVQPPCPRPVWAGIGTRHQPHLIFTYNNMNWCCGWQGPQGRSVRPLALPRAS